jgi:hypothetical protein
MQLITSFFVLSAGLTANTFLMKSTDAGRTWTDLDPGSTDRYFERLEVDAYSSTLYALTRQDLEGEWHLSVSIDGGETWAVRQSFPREVYRVSVAAPERSGTLYLACESFGYPQKKVVIERITERGAAMEEYVPEGLAVVQDGTYIGVLTTLQADPLAPGRLYGLVTAERCCTGDIFALYQALWRSDDGGRNWVRLAPPLSGSCTYPEMQVDASDSSVYVTCGSELFKSTDAGESWRAADFPNGERLWNLQTGAGAPAVLYGNRLGAIWRSVDGAATWQRSGAVPEGADARFLTPHPVDAQVLLASTRDGIAKSKDGGVTWSVATEYPLRAESPFQLVIDPLATDTYYLVNGR